MGVNGKFQGPFILINSKFLLLYLPQAPMLQISPAVHGSIPQLQVPPSQVAPVAPNLLQGSGSQGSVGSTMIKANTKD